MKSALRCGFGIGVLIMTALTASAFPSDTGNDTTRGEGGFLFVGNQLALDFLNTRPAQNGEPEELLPDFSALLGWFQAAELITARDVVYLQRKWGKSIRAQRTVEGDAEEGDPRLGIQRCSSSLHRS